MLCSSHLAILSILLISASSTPVIPRDDAAPAGRVVGERMEPVGDFEAPAVPRQVYTGHHRPADDQALTTEAPSTPTDSNVHALEDGRDRAGLLKPRAAADTTDATDSSSPTILCDLPPQTAKVTVITTATMIMNLATLLPKPLTPRGLYAAANAEDAPPIPTADESPYHNPGGIIVKATPPLVPALETTVPTASLSASLSESASALSPASNASTSAAKTFSGVAVTPVLSAQACTTTMLGNLAKPCHAAGSLTLYTSTITYYSPVDCGRCASLHVIQPKWGCPYMSVKEEVTADVPYTWTTYMCSGAATPLGDAPTTVSTLSLPTPALSSVTGVTTLSTATVAATSIA